MSAFDFQPRTRLICGPGSVSRIGEVARALEFTRTLLVTDRGLVEAGHAGRAQQALEAAGVVVFPFHDFAGNPDTRMIEVGRKFAAPLKIDSIVGLGGGSSMDCAKGVNFLLTNGGRMQDYWGYGKAARPMLPMIGVPTTTGTGSEAQSYALISDAETHVKMACGDPKAAFRTAILDAELAVSQPESVRGPAAYDALSHAVETFVSTRRTALSECFSRESWRLLNGAFESLIAAPSDIDNTGAMLLGAHLAGLAIESSMLGAAHACANPLTARYGTVHGAAIGLLLEAVVRWNSAVCAARYRELHADLPSRLGDLAAAARLGRRLRDAAVPRDHLPSLAAEAARQWTGQFNPRPFDEKGALEVYECVY